MQPQGVQVASGTLAERNRIESVHKTGRSMEAAIPQHVRGGPWCTFSRSSRQQCHAQVEVWKQGYPAAAADANAWKGKGTAHVGPLTGGVKRRSASKDCEPVVLSVALP